MTILAALDDPELFGGLLRRPETFMAWRAFLAALFALPMTDTELVTYRECTGRTTAPAAPFSAAWLVIGRRGGKSFVLALIAVFLAASGDYTQYLAPGERATVLIIATDRKQARVILRYIKGALKRVPALAAMIEGETAESIDLNNAITIEVATASFRSTRGYTVVCFLADEAAYWPGEDSSQPDVEIINAVKPSMATIPGALMLIASSPYARRGILWDAYRRYHGKDGAPELVWQAETRLMNPTVPEDLIAAAYEEDPSRAAAEYGAQFRSDIEALFIREVVEAAVVLGRHELPQVSGIHYVGFVDPSGGSADSMTCCVAHRDRDGRAIIDAARERKPPFSPATVVEEFAALFKSFNVTRIVGDRWGGEFVKEPFRSHGIAYDLSELTKSDIYQATVAHMNSGKIELLDLPRLTAQLCGLERRTARGGRDSIDHAPGAHDDIANSVAGAALLALGARPQLIISDELLARASMPMGPRAAAQAARGRDMRHGAWGNFR